MHYQKTIVVHLDMRFYQKAKVAAVAVIQQKIHYQDTVVVQLEIRYYLKAEVVAQIYPSRPGPLPH
jgi:hypothetical protein